MSKSRTRRRSTTDDDRISPSCSQCPCLSWKTTWVPCNKIPKQQVCQALMDIFDMKHVLVQGLVSRLYWAAGTMDNQPLGSSYKAELQRVLCFMIRPKNGVRNLKQRESTLWKTISCHANFQSDKISSEELVSPMSIQNSPDGQVLREYPTTNQLDNKYAAVTWQSQRIRMDSLWNASVVNRVHINLTEVFSCKRCKTRQIKKTWCDVHGLSTKNLDLKHFKTIFHRCVGVA